MELLKEEFCAFGGQTAALARPVACSVHLEGELLPWLPVSPVLTKTCWYPPFLRLITAFLSHCWLAWCIHYKTSNKTSSIQIFLPEFPDLPH